MNSKKPITMDEIARLAKVSKPTVSRALSGSDLVNEKTKKHVLAVAQKYGYSVNRNAQKLRQNRSNTIAVSVDFQSHDNNHISDPFIFELLAGVSEALSNRGKDLVLCSHKNNDTESLRLLLSSRTVDGIIFLGQGHRENTFIELSHVNIPFVVWGATTKDIKYSVVGSDNYLGGQLAARHLLSLSRKQWLFVGDIGFDEIHLRQQGFSNIAKEHNIALDIVDIEEFTFDATYRVIQNYLKDMPKIDGVFAWGDTGAMAVIRALQESGYRVPEEVSVIGYNDIQTSAHFSPPITTVRQDTILAGEALVVAMLEAIENGEASRVNIPTELMVRVT